MVKEKNRQDPAALSEGADFNLTSMIDVTFLLIVFFMCITELTDQSKAQLQLPVAVKALTDDSFAGRLIVNVLRDGEIEVMAQRLTETEFDQLVRTEVALSAGDENNFPEKAVLIRADRHAEFKYVQNVMAICMAHKLWQLAFATKDEAF